jgi:hypothetical protein
MLSGEYQAFVDTLLRDSKPVKPMDMPTIWNALVAEELATAA